MNSLIVFIAQYFIFLSVIGWIVVLIRLPKNSRIRYIIFTALIGAGSLLVAALLKHFIHDPRPFVVGHFTPLFAHAPDNGFPSDHTLLGAALAFATFPFSKKIGVLLLANAILVGSMRVAAGVHHWLDIIGSIVICFIVSLIFYGLMRWSMKKHVTSHVDAVEK